MVQLTAELVAELDRQATAEGRSRSALIRDAVDEYLATRRAASVGQRIVEGYKGVPPAIPDAWGQIAGVADAGTREVLQRLDEEERRAGQPPW